MRLPLINALIISFVLAAGITRAEQPGPEAQIKQLLSKAYACRTIDQAQPLLNQARLLHAANQMRLTTLKAAFVKTDIDQAQGRILARQGNADSNPQMQATAVELLTACIKSYDQLAETAAADARELSDRFRWGPSESSQRWREIRGYRSRANYAKAWCWYGIGLASAAGESHDAFAEAIDLFERFTLAGYNGNEVVADCFLGQAMCMSEMGNNYALLQWFDNSVEDSPLAESALWPKLLLIKCKAYRDLRLYLDLEMHCSRYLNKNESELTIDNSTDLQFALMRFDALKFLAGPQNPYRTGYLKRLEETGELLYAMDSQWRDYVVASLSEMDAETPLACLARAKKLLSQDNSNRAAAVAQQGIELIDDDVSEKIAGQLRYVYCLALAGTDRRIEFVNSVSDCLRQAPDKAAAEQLAVLATNSLIEAFKTGDISADQSLSLLQRFGDAAGTERVRDHCDYASAVVMMEQSSFAQALDLLQNASAPDSSLQLQYLFNRSLAGIEAAQQLNDQQDRAVLLDDSLSVFKQILGEIDAGEQTSPSRQMVAQLGTLLADELFKSGYSAPTVLNLCDRLESLALAEDTSARLSALRIKLHLFTGSQEKLSAYLETLSDSDPVNVETIRALVQALESETSSPEHAPDLILQVYETAYRLTIEAGDQVDQQLRARVRLGLAKSYAIAGRHEKAVQMFEQIIQARPIQTADVLTMFAHSLESAGEYSKAAQQWNRLAKGLQPGTEQWFQANYNLFQCTQKGGDSSTAVNMLDYFMIKHKPRLTDNWLAQLTELRKGWQ